jgi:hypothetical protein
MTNFAIVVSLHLYIIYRLHEVLLMAMMPWEMEAKLFLLRMIQSRYLLPIHTISIFVLWNRIY